MGHFGNLSQSKPDFHGDRLRLSRPSLIVNSATSITLGYDETKTSRCAIIFLPADQHDALCEAVAVFNAIMDRHERATNVEEAA